MKLSFKVQVWALALIATSFQGYASPLYKEGGNSRSKLHNFLYSKSSISAKYLNFDLMQQYRVKEFVPAMGIGGADQVGVINIQYAYTNCPQYAVYFRKNGNKKLIVYNHGHGGTPNGYEDFARSFLDKAFHRDGFDIL